MKPSADVKMLIGIIHAVRRYPVKSLRGEVLDSAYVSTTGIPGDRASAFFVRGGHARVGKTYRGKEHERLHLIDDVPTALATASYRGAHVELRRGDHFFDDAPISILVDRWLDTVNDYVGYGVEWERFRPNFFVRAAEDFADSESDLVGSELTLGTVRLRVRCPVERCVVVTYDPRGKARDPRILRFLAARRNAWMGVYCDVLQPGITRIGDRLMKEAPQ